ncbi:MAG: GWxTD domain-containing protein [Ignavibacteriaceae bacterium]
MKTYFTLLLFILSFTFAKAQVEEATEQNAFNSSPKFFEDLLNFSSGKPNSTRIDVFIQVPYTTIQFVKNDTGFTGGFSITVSVFDKDKNKLLAEKTWTDKLFVKEFEQTVSKNNFSLNLKSFYLAPGKYFIRSSVDDIESKSEYPMEFIYNVRDLSSQSTAVSDIMILAKRTEEGGKNKIVPNVSGNVATLQDGLPIFYELYSESPQKVNINYEVLDKKQKIIFQESQAKNIDSGKTQIFYTIKDSSFSLGLYNLRVIIKNTQDQKLVSIQRPFFSHWVGLPTSLVDLDKAIDQLIYIASSSQIDYINAGKTKEEKMKRYLAFWKSQNPTPNTEDNPVFDEYYRRVAYANAHFSQYYEGWKTDRGMVFILLGAPNNVERHPFDIDSKPYEVWEYYNLNVSLVFVDQTGFGDYRLITPLTGDLYRFRR